MLTVIEEFGMEAKLYIGNLSYETTEQNRQEERGRDNGNNRSRYQ